MSLFSRRRVTLTVESGEFDCPACSTPEIFWHRSVRRFLTVGPVPLIPLTKAGEYVECQQCGHRYAVEVLGADPGPRQAMARAEFAQHVAWVMILAAVEAGPFSETQVAVIGDVLGKLATGPAVPDGIRDAADLAIRSQVHLSDYIHRFIEVFREPGRVAVVQQAVEKILRAGGHEPETIAVALGQIRSVLVFGGAASV